MSKNYISGLFKVISENYEGVMVEDLLEIKKKYDEDLRAQATSFTQIFVKSEMKSKDTGKWAAIVQTGTEEKELYGTESGTTQSKIDFTAVIEALKNTPEGSEVKVNVLSGYISKGGGLWMKNWKSNGWKTKEGIALKNEDAWKKIDELCSKRTVNWSCVTEDFEGIKKCSNILTN